MQDKAVETVVSDQVEEALRNLVSEEVAELTKEGKGGPKCWAVVLLKTAAKQLRTPDAPRHPVAHLIAHVLDCATPFQKHSAWRSSAFAVK